METLEEAVARELDVFPFHDAGDGAAAEALVNRRYPEARFVGNDDACRGLGLEAQAQLAA
jgi:hypothetical protein